MLSVPEFFKDMYAPKPMNRVPNCTGKFGRNPRNPIPCNSSLGEVTYLSKLVILCLYSNGFDESNLTLFNQSTFFLIDTNSNIVKSMRPTTSPDFFAAEMKNFIKKQISQASYFDRNTYYEFSQYIDQQFSIEELFEVCNFRTRVMAR